MKKFIAFFSLLFMLVALSASAEGRVYLKDSKVQAGAEGKIDLCIETDKPITSINCEFTLPEGVEVLRWEQTQPFSFNPEINNVLFFNADAFSTGVIATIVVNVSDDAEIGEHPMYVNMATIVEPDLNTYTLPVAENTLTIQKSAVINELPEGFGVTITPFVAKDGDITLNFNYKSSKDIKNLSFDVQLPEGMFFMDDIEWSSENTTSSLTASCTDAPTLSHQFADDDAPTSATIKVAGTYTQKSKKYINAAENYSPLATISACVITQEDTDMYVWEHGIMTDGLSTIKLSNIVLEDIDGNKYEGEYLASVIYGQPAAQEVILYGHYDEATADDFTKALKNVAIADVTAATVDEGVKFTDVLVNEKGGNSYYTRTSANYGTTVLPLDLMTENADKLYRIESMDSEGIIIEEAEQVPANTPCIFKGTINVEGATPTLGVPSEQGLGMTTFKGTYEATSIGAGAGYYIASDGKFYGDGASIRPFRGYFDGAVDGAKSFKVILDTPTGLVDITNQFTKEEIYNLQGMRLNDIQKGVNIKGGKKIYVK